MIGIVRLVKRKRKPRITLTPHSSSEVAKMDLEAC
jgi:hypothetical protein